MNADTEPFQFVTASYLTQVENQKANTIEELQACLEHSSDAAIFYHTFQTLGRHHFLTEGFSNDFAQWVFASVNRSELAERQRLCAARHLLKNSIAERAGADGSEPPCQHKR